jgi:hypothetical protein
LKLGNFINILIKLRKINLTMDKDKKKETDSAEQRPPGQPEELEKPREIGGPAGPEPTRYGDWERRGRCIDF